MLSHAIYSLHITLLMYLTYYAHVSGIIGTDFDEVSEQARHTNCVDRGVA